MKRLNGSSEVINMTRQMKKKDCIAEWIEIKKDMLHYGGLGTPMIGEEEPIFCGGVFFQ
jgi:hypothetical protein